MFETAQKRSHRFVLWQGCSLVKSTKVICMFVFLWCTAPPLCCIAVVKTNFKGMVKICCCLVRNLNMFYSNCRGLLYVVGTFCFQGCGKSPHSWTFVTSFFFGFVETKDLPDWGHRWSLYSKCRGGHPAVCSSIVLTPVVEIQCNFNLGYLWLP